MIEIINHGSNKPIKFIKLCHNCDCRFTYGSEDVTRVQDDAFIHCPECRRVMPHDGKNIAARRL